MGAPSTAAGVTAAPSSPPLSCTWQLPHPSGAPDPAAAHSFVRPKRRKSRRRGGNIKKSQKSPKENLKKKDSPPFAFSFFFFGSISSYISVQMLAAPRQRRASLPAANSQRCSSRGGTRRGGSPRSGEPGPACTRASPGKRRGGRGREEEEKKGGRRGNNFPKVDFFFFYLPARTSL